MEFTKPDALGCDCVRNATENGGGESKSDGDFNGSAAVLNEEEARKHEAMKSERAKRSEEIKTQLQSLNVGELLGMIFRAQEERVATYKVFEE